MTAKITVKTPATKFMPADELTSTYTDRWASTKDELLVSYRKWSSAEIIRFEIVEE